MKRYTAFRTKNEPGDDRALRSKAKEVATPRRGHRESGLQLCAERNISFSLLFLVLTILLPGCNSRPKPDGLPRLHPCEIVITQEGTPLVGADIQLKSKNESCPWPVGGKTDAAGKAVIVTYGQHKGAPEGVFAVSVSSREVETIQEKGSSTASIRHYSLVEESFALPETTPLEIEIKKGSNTRTFDLGKPAKILVETDIVSVTAETP